MMTRAPSPRARPGGMSGRGPELLRPNPATEARLAPISAPTCGTEAGHWPVKLGRPAVSRRARQELAAPQTADPAVQVRPDLERPGGRAPLAEPWPVQGYRRDRALLAIRDAGPGLADCAHPGPIATALGNGANGDPLTAEQAPGLHDPLERQRRHGLAIMHACEHPGRRPTVTG